MKDNIRLFPTGEKVNLTPSLPKMSETDEMLRNSFAMAALPSLIITTDTTDCNIIANNAYIMADSMMDARKKK